MALAQRPKKRGRGRWELNEKVRFPSDTSGQEFWIPVRHGVWLIFQEIERYTVGP